jgi:hypothetical protein
VQDSQINKLEGQIRRLKIGFAFCLAFSVLPWVIGQTAVPKMESKKVIKAETFILVDSKHKTKATLALVDGEPSLAFYNARGEIPALLGIQNENGYLRFSNSEGKTLVGLGIVAQKKMSSTFLILSNSSGGSAELSATGSASHLSLGEDRIDLVTEDKSAVIVVKDKYGNGRIMIGEAEGVCLMSLRRADGTSVFETPDDIKRNATEIKEYLKLKKKFE